MSGFRASSSASYGSTDGRDQRIGAARPAADLRLGSDHAFEPTGSGGAPDAERQRARDGWRARDGSPPADGTAQPPHRLRGGAPPSLSPAVARLRASNVSTAAPLSRASSAAAAAAFSVPTWSDR